jgi:DNA polymerase (family 10)
VAGMRRYGGGPDVPEGSETRAAFGLASGVRVVLHAAPVANWGLAWLRATGSEAHLAGLSKLPKGDRLFRRKGTGCFTEAAVYEACGLPYIPPELREGRGEIELAAGGKLPRLVEAGDIQGELHAHTTASDGANSIEEMAEAARARGYSYLGITDHSQSLKIARGVPEEALWHQIRRIDRLNERGAAVRLLKSAEVDILADGRLDYSPELLAELDYTVCSIHSRFRLPREAQTQRLLRAMDDPHFSILGHATGRLLLRRPGYDIDIERVLRHAAQRGCFVEINASPDRLDLSADHARRAKELGLRIAICTDAHSLPELDYIRCGVDQARRAGLAKPDVLNCLPWPALRRTLGIARRRLARPVR